MPETYTVYHVEDNFVGDSEVWYVDHQRKSDGHTFRHALPKSVIEWRAAEYGLDHTTLTGRQQIIDLVLHEPFMAPIDPQVLHRNGQGKRLASDEIHLYNASTRDQARAAHLSKLAATKTNIAQVVWPNTPGAGIHPMLQSMIDHQPDQSGVDAKTKAVASIRVGLGLDPTPAPVIPAASSNYYDPSIRRRGLTVVLGNS